MNTRKNNSWKFSPKQLMLMFWWKSPNLQKFDGCIATGSVRSGKTVGSSMGFIQWSMDSFLDQQFALCGKTIGALRRNVINPMKKAMPALGLKLIERKNESMIIIHRPSDGRRNSYYMFGGYDESSQDVIQGITLAGAYFDEVALMPESFVKQALARCSISGSKFWFNCNPASPSHWFKTGYIDQLKEKKMIYMHFTMHDNWSLDPNIIARYETLFSGVFYRRFVLGEWCLAEGLVYSCFNPETMIIDTPSNDYTEYYAAMDYGITNPTAILIFGWSPSAGRWEMFREFYYDGHEKEQLTDGQIYKHLEKMAGDLPIKSVIIDPSAASMLAEIRNRKKYRSRGAVNDVLPGIRFTQTVLTTGKLVFLRSCRNTLREFGEYVWDQDTKDGKDAVVKKNDHAMDALRYFCYTHIRAYAKRYGITFYETSKEPAA